MDTNSKIKFGIFYLYKYIHDLKPTYYRVLRLLRQDIYEESNRKSQKSAKIINSDVMMRAREYTIT